MTSCYICKEEHEGFTMSSYRLEGGGPVVGAICVSCGQTPTAEEQARIDAYHLEQASQVKAYECDMCHKGYHYADEMVFDRDELKTVDELNPDWSTCMCRTCYDERFIGTMKLVGGEWIHIDKHGKEE